MYRSKCQEVTCLAAPHSLAPNSAASSFPIKLCLFFSKAPSGFPYLCDPGVRMGSNQQAIFGYFGALSLFALKSRPPIKKKKKI